MRTYDSEKWYTHAQVSDRIRDVKLDYDYEKYYGDDNCTTNDRNATMWVGKRRYCTVPLE